MDSTRALRCTFLLLALTIVAVAWLSGFPIEVYSAASFGKCSDDHGFGTPNYWRCMGEPGIAHRTQCDNDHGFGTPSYWRCMGEPGIAHRTQCDNDHGFGTPSYWRCMGEPGIAHRTQCDNDHGFGTPNYWRCLERTRLDKKDKQPNDQPGDLDKREKQPGNEPSDTPRGNEPNDTPGGNEPGDTPGGNEPGDTPGGNEPGDTPGGNEPGDTPGGNEPGDTPGGNEPGDTPGGSEPEPRIVWQGPEIGQDPTSEDCAALLQLSENATLNANQMAALHKCLMQQIAICQITTIGPQFCNKFEPGFFGGPVAPYYILPPITNKLLQDNPTLNANEADSRARLFPNHPCFTELTTIERIGRTQPDQWQSSEYDQLFSQISSDIAARCEHEPKIGEEFEREMVRPECRGGLDIVVNRELLIPGALGSVSRTSCATADALRFDIFNRLAKFDETGDRTGFLDERLIERVRAEQGENLRTLSELHLNLPPDQSDENLVAIAVTIRGAVVAVRKCRRGDPELGVPPNPISCLAEMASLGSQIGGTIHKIENNAWAIREWRNRVQTQMRLIRDRQLDLEQPIIDASKAVNQLCTIIQQQCLAE